MLLITSFPHNQFFPLRNEEKYFIIWFLDLKVKSSDFELPSPGLSSSSVLLVRDLERYHSLLIRRMGIVIAPNACKYLKNNIYS